MEHDQQLLTLITEVSSDTGAFKTGYRHGISGRPKDDKFIYFNEQGGITKSQAMQYISGYEKGVEERKVSHQKEHDEKHDWKETTGPRLKNIYSEETLDEVINAKAPISVWIKDFIESDDPRFAGKTKEERRKMAIGAFYGAKKTIKEELSEAVKSSKPKEYLYTIHFERDEPYGAKNPTKVNDSIELRGRSKDHVKFKFSNLVKEGDVSGVKVRHIMRNY